MNIRTDLALEKCQGISPVKGVFIEEDFIEQIKITRTHITDNRASQTIGKEKGNYITIEFSPLMDNVRDKNAYTAIKNELLKFVYKYETMLVVGLGNISITPDSLGPKTAKRILATRHLSKQLAKEIGLEGMKSVAVLSPGVLGQTGIETMEIIKGTVENIKPSAVLTIDALAAKDIDRLGCTVQICDSGISPGSGVGNRRCEISKKSLGIPVFSLGVPTVVDASTLVYELAGENSVIENKHSKMIVTPREIDMLIDRSSELIGHAINCALQPNIDEYFLMTCV